MTEDIRRAAIAQIIGALKAQEIAPDEFTVGMFAEQAGMKDKEARDSLLGMVRDGKLQARKVLFDGRWQWAFRDGDNAPGAIGAAEHE